MSTPVTYYDPVSSPLATSGEGILHHVRDFFIVFGDIHSTQSTTTTTSPLALPEWIASEQTNSGLPVVSPIAGQVAAIAELRQRSGLTWQQLARLFGVARRSVHFWASGKAMNASNENRLNELLRMVRYIYRGGSGQTRSALMTAQPDGTIPFEVLAEGRFDDVMTLLGRGPGYGVDVLSKVLGAEVPLLAPPSPDRLVRAVQDTVHTSRGRARAGRSAKVKRKP